MGAFLGHILDRCTILEILFSFGFSWVWSFPTFVESCRVHSRLISIYRHFAVGVKGFFQIICFTSTTSYSEAFSQAWYASGPSFRSTDSLSKSIRMRVERITLISPNSWVPNGRLVLISLLIRFASFSSSAICFFISRYLLKFKFGFRFSI